MKAASPSPRRSSARPPDGRARAAAHNRTRCPRAAPVEPRDVAPRPGVRPTPRAARRVAQHGGPRRALARGAGQRAGAGAGGAGGAGGRDLALRVAGSRLRAASAGGRCDEARGGTARRFTREVRPQPSVVLLAPPPDWDRRFLARTLSDVARVPVRTFVESEPDGGGWRDAANLTPVSTAEVTRVVAGARLVVRAGNPAPLDRFASTGAILTWSTTRGQEGDWYVQPPGPSPLADALAGIAGDSLAPAAAVSDLALPSDSAAVVVLTARLARRGNPRPVIVLSERDGAGWTGGGARRAAGPRAPRLRGRFAGGARAEAYLAVVPAGADWRLAGGAGGWERFVPVTHAAPNGMPVAWRWTGAGSPRDVAVELTAAGTSRTDTLRFDATGRAELSLPPGVYSYESPTGPERGVVALETYSDEWRPATPVLHAQAGGAAGRLASVPMRERWWLFVVAIAAFASEWAWRRRQGLP